MGRIIFAPFGDAVPIFIRQPWVPLRYTHGYLKFAPFGDSIITSASRSLSSEK
jgi:hypothetical protein